MRSTFNLATPPLPVTVSVLVVASDPRAQRRSYSPAGRFTVRLADFPTSIGSFSATMLGPGARISNSAARLVVLSAVKVIFPAFAV